MGGGGGGGEGGDPGGVGWVRVLTQALQDLI